MNLLGKKCLSCSFYLYRFRKYLSYGVPIINICNPGVHYETPCIYIYIFMGIAVAQWLKCCATERKIAGSIPAGVSKFFIDIKSFRSHYCLGVESASNSNEYQEHFLR